MCRLRYLRLECSWILHLSRHAGYGFLAHSYLIAIDGNHKTYRFLGRPPKLRITSTRAVKWAIRTIGFLSLSADPI